MDAQRQPEEQPADSAADPTPCHGGGRTTAKLFVDENDVIAMTAWIERQQRLHRPIIGGIVRARVGIRTDETRRGRDLPSSHTPYHTIPALHQLYQSAAAFKAAACIPVDTRGRILAVRSYLGGQYLVLVQWAHSGVSEPQWVESDTLLPSVSYATYDAAIDAAAVRITERQYQRRHDSRPARAGRKTGRKI